LIHPAARVIVCPDLLVERLDTGQYNRKSWAMRVCSGTDTHRPRKTLLIVRFLAIFTSWGGQAGKANPYHLIEGKTFNQ